jgi:phospholipid transport system transporter-binding protein
MMAEHGPDSAPARGFIAEEGGARWSYEGPLTFAEAGPVVTAAHALALPREGEIDLTRLGAFDSAAVAVLVALTRRAAREGRSLHFTGLPPGVRALAALYGVLDFLPA